MSVSSKMTAIANKIRTLLGISGTMGLDAMATNLGTVQDEVDGQSELISQIATVLSGKAGGSVPTGTKETWTFTLENGNTVEKVVYVDNVDNV